MSNADKTDETPDDPQQNASDESTSEPTPLGDNLGVHIPSREEAPDEEDPQFEVKIDFGTFLIGFFQTGMMNLGRIEHPETGETVTDMKAAKHNVEILELLQQKTEGNLDDEEENLLQRLLYDLKVAYSQTSSGKADA